jgi:hypothetical protein
MSLFISLARLKDVARLRLRPLVEVARLRLRPCVELVRLRLRPLVASLRLRPPLRFLVEVVRFARLITRVEVARLRFRCPRHDTSGLIVGNAWKE